MSIVKILMNKITAAILILVTAVLLVFFGMAALAPEATENLRSDSSSFVGGVLDVFVFDEIGVDKGISGFFEKIGIPSFSFGGLEGEGGAVRINILFIILCLKRFFNRIQDFFAS